MRLNLSLSVDYVPSWTYLEAVRELYQNAFDGATVDPSATWSSTYEQGCLSIFSKGATLTRETPLLGTSSKREDKRTIGTFGEGYKLAMLVLIRSGFGVVIYNYGNREVWRPSIKYSRTFKSDVLGVDIERFIFTDPPHADLCFCVKGITPQHWHLIRGFNLHLNEYPPHIPTVMGNILLESRYRGHVFINGLFVQVSKDKKMAYGYDVKPQHLSLDRDRKMVNGFDLYYLTSNMWSITNDGERLSILLKDGSPDVQYIQYHYHQPKPAVEVVGEAFAREYGDNAVPVKSQQEMDTLRLTQPAVRPVIVSEAYSSVLYRSARFRDQGWASLPAKKTPQEIVQAMIDERGDDLVKYALPDLIKVAKEWVWR